MTFTPDQIEMLTGLRFQPNSFGGNSYYREQFGISAHPAHPGLMRIVSTKTCRPGTFSTKDEVVTFIIKDAVGV